MRLFGVGGQRTTTPRIGGSGDPPANRHAHGASHPPGVTTGSLTLRLYDVPPDVTGSLTIGDAPTPLTLAVGQAAALTFSGTASQQVTVRITDNATGSVQVRLLRPDGTQQAWNSSGASSFTLATQTLATTGTYTVTVNPTGVGAGGIAVQVTSP